MGKGLLFGLVALASACSGVRNQYVRPDYEAADRTKTVRLAVITSPLPEGNEQLGLLWSEMARKYTNDHRDFIVKTAHSAAKVPWELCVTSESPLEGLLVLEPKLARAGAAVDVDVEARLLRCSDGMTVWTASLADAWPSEDETLTEVRKHYVTKYGDGVQPYVAPSFQALRTILELMPKPQLDDAGVMEKIDLDE